jgi:hypothetical protein
MRRPLAKVGAAVVLGAILATLAAVSPASAINVRYRAAKSCTVDGKTFRADIQTYGRPTPAHGAYTEVQLWGFYFESGADAGRVEATEVTWRDGSWQNVGGIGYAIDPSAGRWHNGPKLPGTHTIGYARPDMPRAVQVRGYTGGFNYHFCTVFLRPADLLWIG